MSLTDQSISGIRNTLTKQTDTSASVVGNISDSVSSAIQNPIAGKLNKVLNKINSATANVESKIDKLVNNITASSDNKSKIELIGNNIVITVKPEDIAVLNVQQQKIQSNINSITGTLSILQNSVNTLSTINDTVKTLKKVLDVQEALMTVNPVTKASFEVFKKAIKIVFLKDMLTQYSKIVDSQLSSNKQILNNLIERFDHLRVQVKVTDESNKGNVIDPQEARKLISKDLLSTSSDTVEEEFMNDSGKTYVLKIERFDTQRLIGKAYDKYSGQLVTQTAPSIIFNSQYLLDELKTILN